jgi:hypothetical protein
MVLMGLGLLGFGFPLVGAHLKPQSRLTDPRRLDNPFRIAEIAADRAV